MKYPFIPLRRVKLMSGFTHTFIDFDNELQACSYAKEMIKDYSPYGCTYVKIDVLDK